MGRGRAKAKQTKVARELKYQTRNTDLAALQRELAGSKSDDDFADEYADHTDDEDEDLDDDSRWTSRR